MRLPIPCPRAVGVAFAAAICLASAGPLRAQSDGPAPDDSIRFADSSFSLRLNVSGLLQSEVGRFLLQKMEQANDSPKTIEQYIDDASESLGLSLREDVGHVTAYVAGPEPMVEEVKGGFTETVNASLASVLNDRGLVIVADLGEEAGNVEGLLLLLPAYERLKTEAGGELHAFSAELRPRGLPVRQVRMFAGLVRADGEIRLISSTEREIAERLVDAPNPRTLLPPTDTDELLSLRLDYHGREKPAAAMNPMLAGVNRTLDRLELSVREDAGLVFDLSLAGATPAQSRQLNQLVHGLRGIARSAIEAARDEHAAAYLEHGGRPSADLTGVVIAGAMLDRLEIGRPQRLPGDDPRTAFSLSLRLKQGEAEDLLAFAEDSARLPEGAAEDAHPLHGLYELKRRAEAAGGQR